MSSSDSNIVLAKQPSSASPQPSIHHSSISHLLEDEQTYKEQFISIIKQGSPALLESEKECLAILGTCPKSNTKVAFWYGKYGGPFTWKFNGVPVDDLDLVCRMHDQRLHLKYVKKLVNLVRQHYGDDKLSKDALSYIKKMDGRGFEIIEPIYMIFFGSF